MANINLEWALLVWDERVSVVSEGWVWWVRGEYDECGDCGVGEWGVSVVSEGIAHNEGVLYRACALTIIIERKLNP